MIELTHIRLYPIKSCAGTEVESAYVTRRGPRGDRTMMVVDAEGVFLTQRKHPRMALIRPVAVENIVTLRAEGMEPLAVDTCADRPARAARIWADRLNAFDLGPEASEWFSTFLGFSCSLVRQTPERRPVDPAFAVAADDEVSFADGYPLLLTSAGSLADLNERIGGVRSPLPMDRFRPNVVVDGASAFAEDEWRRITMGEVDLAVVKPCARCVMTTVNQRTAEKGPEPLRTLAGYRRGPGGGAYFGQNLIPLNEGWIRVGDRVTLG